MTATNILTGDNASAERLLSIQEVAETLGVGVRHVRRLVQERRIPFIKWGHLLRFDPAAVQGWLDDNRREVILRNRGR